MFRNVYTECSPIVSNSGELTRPNYKPMYNENGSYTLVEDGVIHSYEDIQSWKATCDMSTIIERYIRTGDSSILNQRAGFYADVTQLPTNYAELANTLRNADLFFNALPAEVKQQFEFNPAKFYATADISSVLADVYNVKDDPQKVDPVYKGKEEPQKVDPVPSSKDNFTNSTTVTNEGGVASE